MDDKCDYLFKIILIGDAGVGKTCIVQRFKTGSWFESQASTIGVDFCLKSCVIDEKQIKLQVWDTAGQERFRTITQAYYRSAHGVICTFDLTNESSFDNTTEWMKDVTKYCSPNVVKLLVGNKCDMVVKRKIPFETAAACGQMFGVMEYLETSAKENTNINDAFMKMAKQLLNQQQNVKELDMGKDDGFNIGGNTRSVGTSCCF